MKTFKCICIPLAVLALASCSYFDTEETIVVTSEGMEEAEPVTRYLDDNSVESLIYNRTDGAVEIYNLDMSEGDAAHSFDRYQDGEISSSSNGLVMEPGVEVYPIDIPMQNTLKP